MKLLPSTDQCDSRLLVGIDRSSGAGEKFPWPVLLCKLCSLPHLLPCFSSVPEFASSHNLEQCIVQLKRSPWGRVFQNCLLISARKDKPETRADGENLYLLRSRCCKTQIFLPNIGEIGLFSYCSLSSPKSVWFSHRLALLFCVLCIQVAVQLADRWKGNCICFSLNKLY